MVRSERVPARGYRSNERAAGSGPACPYLRAPGDWWSLEALGGRAGGPAVACSGLLDESADDYECGGQIQVEVDDLAVAFGAASQLAVAVYPGVGSLYHPAPVRLDRGGHALAGDLAANAQCREQPAGGGVVVATVQM